MFWFLRRKSKIRSKSVIYQYKPDELFLNSIDSDTVEIQIGDVSIQFTKEEWCSFFNKLSGHTKIWWSFWNMRDPGFVARWISL